MSFERSRLRISLTKHESNDIVCAKMETKRRFILNIKKRQLKLLGYILRNFFFGNISGQIEGNKYKSILA